MLPNVEVGGGQEPPSLPIPEIRDYQKINAELVALLDEGHRLVRLEGAEGQRLLASGLSGPWNAVVEIVGRTGPEVAANLDAPGLIIVAKGSTADGAGRGLLAGRVVILGDAGDALGYAQSGGILVVQGSAGHRAGLAQSGGTLAILGKTGRLACDRQAGGRCFLPRGQIGPHAGRGRLGGRLIEFPDPSGLGPDDALAWREVAELVAPWIGAFVVASTMNRPSREVEMARHFQPLRPWIAMVILGLSGCSEELGPERFPTSTVRGVVSLGKRPVGGGWIAFEPVEGTRGNLRIARIKPDGSFVADRVPAGRVLIGLDQVPIDLIPTPSGPVDSRSFKIQRSPIRRTIPEGRDVELPIDLLEEAIRSRRSVKGSRRNRNRSNRKSNGRAGTLKESGPPTAPHASPSLPRVRVAYREGSGTVHLDWPADQVARAVADPEGTVWVDIEDIESANNASVEAMLRDVFQFHPLAIEDALKDTHVPKIDDWGTYLYVVVDTLDFDPETDEIRLHELDLFLGANFLVSYHNEAIEVLERHRRHLEREPDGRLKFGIAAHLLYRLLDEVVAEFLPAIEHLDNEIDDAQDEVFNVPTPRTLRKIFLVKRNALRLHRVVIPMREVLNRLARDPYVQIQTDDRIYFRDVYDHLVRIHDIIESLRDLIAGALDTYLSVVSNRTNDIMKALTIVNVMFLPLTFIAGFFGMNFFGDTLMFVAPLLPKARLFWGACIVMIGTPVGMAIMARRRGWI